jgi:hypothetical protein
MLNISLGYCSLIQVLCERHHAGKGSDDAVEKGAGIARAEARSRVVPCRT